MTLHACFATAPLGVEPLLAAELRSLGASDVRETRAGVYFSGSLDCAYRVCLWSRLASRILLPLCEFPAADPDQLYAGAMTVVWEDHLSPDATFAVDAALSASNKITHSRFAALRVKDAVVDRLRELRGERPNVNVEQPDVRINLYVNRDRATLSLDLSGESLHRRGYRQEGVVAPLKENLAAAILLRAGWAEIAAAGGALVDPMCGSGTFLIEAGLIAADIAPGLSRETFGFLRWSKHEPQLWRELVNEARERREVGLLKLPTLIGCDVDGGAVRAARINADQAGFGGRLRFSKQSVGDLRPPEGVSVGLVVVNPPYGERLGEKTQLAPLYAELGAVLRERFVGWKAAVFTGNPELAKSMGLRAYRHHTLYNGALECRLLHFEIDPGRFFGAQSAPPAPPAPLTPGAEMFANRLRKNLKTLGKWAREQGITCYRLYDADMPEYAVVVDLYHDWVHVQEYEAPKTIDAEQARLRFKEVLAALPVALEIPRERIALKVRKRQKGKAQYEKFGAQGRFLEVDEGGCKLLVNLTDYLDTGLFLDHRPLRQLIGEQAQGKRFLNLFCYTGAATIHAIKGGASETVSVDLSNTYLDWARRNFDLNQIRGAQHQLVRADCLEWLEQERRRFDLIFLDPPTFSTSKGMERTLDVQRDHVRLLRSAARLLAPGGVLFFSTNLRKFKLESENLPELEFVEITAATIPRDFSRNPRIHSCWRVARR